MPEDKTTKSQDRDRAQVTIHRDTYRQLRIVAAYRDTSVADLASEILDQGIKELPEAHFASSASAS